MKKNVGTSYFKDLSRKDYVVQASRIIKKEGVEAISIRRIAAELGCSSASMYRYFQNLDELLFYAQLDALNEYILDLSKCEKEWNDIWDVHFGIWRSYAKEAFKKPQAFEAVFYRNINRDLGEALKEYYEMFPDAIIQVSPFIKEMLEIPSYYQRDYYICKLLVAEGKISEENAKKLNHIICTLFLGYFKFVQEHGISQDEIPELVNQFIQESKEITQCSDGLCRLNTLFPGRYGSRQHDPAAPGFVPANDRRYFPQVHLIFSYGNPIDRFPAQISRIDINMKNHPGIHSHLSFYSLLRL